MLGGGQLGRYTIVAARLIGYGTIVVDPDPDAPAGRVADVHLVAPYDDPEAGAELAASCAVVTTEFENPPADVLRALAARTMVAPSADAVAVAQDRIAEKRFLVERGLAVAPYAVIRDVADLDTAVASVAGPAILKTARLGYDGRGQTTVGAADDVGEAWAGAGRVPCVLEQRVPLDAELSVIVARTAGGCTAVYPVAENRHEGGVLDVSAVPARVEPRLAAEAQRTALDVAEALRYVGVLAVEMFVSDGRILVNELAPRPHNSGHWTLDAAATSQFDQQIRAICGLALGPTELTGGAVAMANLLGDGWRHGEPDWSAVLAAPDVHLHLYGKSAARAGRKMGHLTVRAADADEAVRRVLELRRRAFARSA